MALKRCEALGLLTLRRGAVDEAIALMDSGVAVGALPAYVSHLRYHYGLALEKYGDYRQSRGQLERVIEACAKMNIPWLKEMAERSLSAQGREDE